MRLEIEPLSQKHTTKHQPWFMCFMFWEVTEDHYRIYWHLRHWADIELGAPIL